MGGIQANKPGRNWPWPIQLGFHLCKERGAPRRGPLAVFRYQLLGNGQDLAAELSLGTVKESSLAFRPAPQEHLGIHGRQPLEGKGVRLGRHSDEPDEATTDASPKGQDDVGHCVSFVAF